MNAADSAALAAQAAALTLPADVVGAIFPNTLAFTAVHGALENSAWAVGAQNVAWVPQGAYTGATSALFFKEAGARYALVGHSERRHIFNESETSVAKKMAACWAVGLTPVLCVGETAADAEAGKRQQRLREQIETALVDVTAENVAADRKNPPAEFVIAYEPVWAVGTGNPCTAADANDVAGWIKLLVAELTGQTAPVVYGGSVSSANVGEFMSVESLDGVLVGSQSAQASTLAPLVAALSPQS